MPLVKSMYFFPSEPVQVDGEVSEFERGVSVTVEIVPSALKTVL